jgi:hypothetical protein
MSSSSEHYGSSGSLSQANTAELRIESPAGVEYSVFNGQGEECFSGSGDQLLPLSPGLYAIHWLSAGTQQETLLRVTDRNGPTWASFPRATGAVETDAGGSPEPLAQQLTATTPTLSAEVAMISVIVRRVTAPGEAESLPSSFDNLKLLDQRSREQEADRTPDRLLSLQTNEVARHFSVMPGDYVLSFRSVTGETLQQTVPALPGRRTLIFQEEFGAKVYVAEGEVFRDQRKYGVDPGRTVIITVNGDEEHERIRERLRLAAILLHDIATGSTSLDQKFVGILDDPRTDPLLRLLGAIVAIRELKAARRVTQRETAALVSAEQALRWLSLDKGLYLAPDETVARWLLNRIMGDRRQVRSRHSIGNPPMLEMAWRWALEIRQEEGEPGTIGETPATRAAASSAISGGVWLCWRASATKAAESSIPSRLERNARIQELVKTVTDLVTRAGLADSKTVSRILAPDIRQGTQKVLDTLLTPDNLELYGSVLAKNSKLNQVFEQMQQLSSVLAASRAESAMPSAGIELANIEQAPGLSRMILFPDDPHKARFGGTSAREGFIMSATFANSRKPGWTRVTLTVTGPARDGETLRLHLHESFPEPVKELTFEKKKVSMTMLAWGGFTVGGWLPKRGIELELDLAECEGAPKPIRTR